MPVHLPSGIPSRKERGHFWLSMIWSLQLALTTLTAEQRRMSKVARSFMGCRHLAHRQSSQRQQERYWSCAGCVAWVSAGRYETPQRACAQRGARRALRRGLGAPAKGRARTEFCLAPQRKALAMRSEDSTAPRCHFTTRYQERHLFSAGFWSRQIHVSSTPRRFRRNSASLVEPGRN